MAKKKRKLKVSDGFTFIVAVIILIVAVVWYYHEKDKKENQYTGVDQIFTSATATTAKTEDMKIHFIDIGQGDCVFIEFPDGKNMLIDSGNRGKGDEVVSYLKGLGIDDITLVLATHVDSDHIGGMNEVFAEYDIDYCLRPFVYYNGEEKGIFEDSFNMPSSAEKFKNCDTATYKNFLTYILNENCGYEYFNMNTDFSQDFIYNGNTYNYSVDFLTPTASVPNIGYTDSNDYSPLFTVTYGNFVIMLTGDAHANVEEELINYYPTIADVDVLKVGHHGSESSSSEEFVRRISPEYAVIMCGKDNSYGHPRQSVLDIFTGESIGIFRTDLQGNIVITVNSNGDYDFETQKSASLTDLITGVPSV